MFSDKVKQYFSNRLSNEKTFGYFFSLIFLLVGIYYYLNFGKFLFWPFIISLLLFFLGLVFPRSLYYPNKLWISFGNILGYIITPVILAVLFFSIFTITGALMKIFKIHTLYKKLDSSQKTYWVSREEPVGPMRNQF